MNQRVNNGFVNDLARRLAAAVPGGVQSVQADLERNFQGLLQGAFARLDLVTREEFDIQRRVLERTREKLTRLEAEVAQLESSGNQNQSAER
jgi:BMFP domain-containing protein YqiC